MLYPSWLHILMSNLRRYHDPRTLYFITCVTYNRCPLLVQHSDLLRESLTTTRERAPFDLQAWVVLPDHFHILLDVGGNSISGLMQRIKMSFAARLRKRLEWQSGRVWQHRFWDHIIRDQEDQNRHIDYIHYNPVKHGYVASPFKWIESSFLEYAERGVYGQDWGEKPIAFDGEYGE